MAKTCSVFVVSFCIEYLEYKGYLLDTSQSAMACDLLLLRLSNRK